MRSHRHRPYPCYRAATGSSPSTDVLRTHGVLRPAQRVQEVVVRSGALVEASTSHTFRKSLLAYHRCFQQRPACSGKRALQQVPHTARMSQCFIAFRIAVSSN